MSRPSSVITGYTILVLCWVLAIVIVGIHGEFPVNDDWAYADNVFQLTENHVFHVNTWPAMTLVSQTLWGSIFTGIFGFSFGILRLSTLILSLLSSVFLFRFFSSRVSIPVALMGTITFCYGQIFLALSFTFMTDVFFLTALAGAFYAFDKYCRTRKRKYYAFFIAWLLVAVLCRQHGLLLSVFMLFPLVFFPAGKRNYFLGTLPVLFGFGVHIGYRVILKLAHIPHNMYGAGKMKDFLLHMDIRAVHIHAGDMLLVCGWLLLPASILLIQPSLQWVRLHVWKSVMLTVALTFIVLADFPFFPQGNIVRLAEAGPRVVMESMSAKVFSGHQTIRFFMFLLSGFSLLISLFAVLSGWKTRDKMVTPFSRAVIFFSMVYFVFVLTNEAYFDRYALPLGLALLIIVLPGVEKVRKWQWIMTSCLVAVTWSYSVTLTRDYMQWQRTRWKALDYLQQKGIGPDKTDGGFEYNGWYKPGLGFKEGKSWWWVKDDEWVVTDGHVNGYRADTVFTSPRWLPYTTDSVFVLRRKSTP